VSRLQLHGRPFVVFDAKNKDHRRWFSTFNQTLSWGTCPVRFVVNDDHGDLITMIQRELIAHYVNKEFGEVKVPVAKPKRKRVVKKSTKIDTK
jgi:hypothetical protein